MLYVDDGQILTSAGTAAGMDLCLHLVRLDHGAWALTQLSEPLSVEVLARHAAMSPRTFARRFRQVTGTTPGEWLLEQRLALARRMLETTDQTVDWIAHQVGFGSAATLRHHSPSGWAPHRAPTATPSAARPRRPSPADGPLRR